MSNVLEIFADEIDSLASENELEPKRVYKLKIRPRKTGKKGIVWQIWG